MSPDALFILAAIILSVIIHEVMHGVAANALGDPTARLAGRLTLNPLPHIDPIGSVLLPLFFAMTPGNFFFGWAKPVPYNPYNLRPGRFSEAIVAAAGPLSNLGIALLFGFLYRSDLFPAMDLQFSYIIAINVSLALLNFLPVPPLDGSKVLASLLPAGLSRAYEAWRLSFESNLFLGFGLILVLIFVFGSAFGSAVVLITRAIAGV